MRIDIGGGLARPDPFHMLPAGADWTNLDPIHGEGTWQRVAQNVPWPVDAETVTHVRASHVLEHIPAGGDRIAVFNETHRVLQPGRCFEILVPLLLTRDGTVHWKAIADPTHISYWCQQSFDYFLTDNIPNADYGIRPWQLAEYRETEGCAYVTLVKP